MTTEEAKREVATYKLALTHISELKAELSKTFREFVKDRSVDLDTRWDLFIESEMGSTGGWIEDWKSLRSYTTGKEYRNTVEEIYIHNGDSFSKYQVIGVHDIYERLLDEVDYVEEIRRTGEIPKYKTDFIDEFKNSLGVRFDINAVNEFREEALSKFIYSYNFDW